MLMLIFVKLIEVFHVLPASELLTHDHFIFAIFRRLGEQLLLLVFLSHVNYLCPVLFVVGLEVSQKVVETLVTFGHVLDGCIE